MCGYTHFGLTWKTMEGVWNQQKAIIDLLVVVRQTAVHSWGKWLLLYLTFPWELNRKLRFIQHWSDLTSGFGVILESLLSLFKSLQKLNDFLEFATVSQMQFLETEGAVRYLICTIFAVPRWPWMPWSILYNVAMSDGISNTTYRPVPTLHLPPNAI